MTEVTYQQQQLSLSVPRFLYKDNVAGSQHGGASVGEQAGSLAGQEVS